MRTKEDYLKMYKILQDSQSTEAIEQFANNFDINVLNIVNDIYQNAEKYDLEKWNAIYKNSNNHFEVLKQMLLTKCCPISIIEKIINNSQIVKDNIEISYKQPENDKSLFNIMLNYDLPQNLFDIIYHYTGNAINKKFDKDLYSSEKDIKEMHQNVIKKICEKAIENYKPPESVRKILDSKRDKALDCLVWIEDKHWIEKIAERDIHENINTALLNNKYLQTENPDDEKLMNKIFQNGCVLDLIDKYTPHISRECSMSFYEGFMNGFDDSTGLPKSTPGNTYYECRSQLEKMANKEGLDPDYEYDLACRLIEIKNRSSDRLVETLFSKTRNKSIMKMIADIKSVDKPYAYKHNPHIPEDIMQEVSYKLLDKMHKAEAKGEIKKISDVWYEQLAEYSYKTTFRDKDYMLLFKRGDRKNCMDIISSPKTPDNILYEAIVLYKKGRDNISYYASNLIVAAKWNLFTRHSDLSERAKNELIKFAIEAPSSIDVNDMYATTHYANQSLSYAKQSIRFIVDYCEAKDCYIVKQYLEEYLKNQDLEKNERNIVQYALNYLNHCYKIKMQIQEWKENKNVKNYTDEYLKNRLREIRSAVFYNKNSYYITMPQFINEFYEIYDEIQEREKMKKEISENEKDGEEL